MWRLRKRRKIDRDPAYCDVSIPHKVFVTAPPGYGGILPCPGTHQFGIPVTLDEDGAFRTLNGGMVVRRAARSRS